MFRTSLLIWIIGIAGLIPNVQEDSVSGRVSEGIVFHIFLADEPITPVTARYIRRALREATAVRAHCLVIELDTPGGLMQSTQEIVRAILASDVPVIVYVAPSGARAASAGVFITLASHVAAMAPGTHMGAAHPVSIGGLPGTTPSEESSEDQSGQPSVMEEKVVNDAVAWARSLAELRGRNAEWAALAVSESRSIISEEAIEEGVIDLIGRDLDDLLEQLDGREIQMPKGPLLLQTRDTEVHTLEMWWGERLLGAVSNPNVAFLLLMFGFYGILFEFYTPGWGVGGTLGIICLMLGFFGLSVLPINYAGLALIVLGLGLFVAEAFVTSFGALSLGGVVCLVLGGLMLIDSPFDIVRISAWIVVPVALATAFIAFFLLGNVLKSVRGRIQTGSEAMLGTTGIAQADFVFNSGRYSGTILTHGELWNAVSAKPVTKGQTVIIKKRKGLTLAVEG